jgi:hypothetical protein
VPALTEWSKLAVFPRGTASAFLRHVKMAGLNMRSPERTEGGTEMKATESTTGNPTYWQLIFLQSKVNGASYNGEALARHNWDWPKETYLQDKRNPVSSKASFS